MLRTQQVPAQCGMKLIYDIENGITEKQLLAKCKPQTASSYFKDRGGGRLFCITMPIDQPSVKVIEKCGFVRVTTFINNNTLNEIGVYHKFVLAV